MTTWTPDPAGGRAALGDPRGQARGGKLRTLSAEECFGLLESGGLGRVGLLTAEGIAILPVNYVIAAKTVVFRTAPDTLLAALGHGPVSFEADRVDEASREGWSVLLQGHARTVDDEKDVRRLELGTGLEPWASGARDVWVRIIPARISGRRVGQA